MRPSSKGYDQLTISWKFYDGIIVHIPVLEQDKPNDWSLGKKLVIGEDTYADLDDVVVNFIDEMVSISYQVTSHRKFHVCYRTAHVAITLY